MPQINLAQFNIFTGYKLKLDALLDTVNAEAESIPLANKIKELETKVEDTKKQISSK